MDSMKCVGESGGVRYTLVGVYVDEASEHEHGVEMAVIKIYTYRKKVVVEK